MHGSQPEALFEQLVELSEAKPNEEAELCSLAPLPVHFLPPEDRGNVMHQHPGPANVPSPPAILSPTP